MTEKDSTRQRRKMRTECHECGCKDINREDGFYQCQHCRAFWGNGPYYQEPILIHEEDEDEDEAVEETDDDGRRFQAQGIPHGDENECPIRMLDYYDPHFGTPFYWRHEPSGKLEAAITTYIAYASGDRTAPTAQQLSLLVDYLKYWINASCWQQPETEYWLDRLRARSYSLNTVAEVSNWLDDCLKLGLDPL